MTLEQKSLREAFVLPPEKTIPLAEIFGPTIQGEGLLSGVPTYFLRIGGCDYKCDWCDTDHAVVPEKVRLLERKTQGQLLEQLLNWTEDHPGPDWLAISGGNPAMYDLTEVVEGWHTASDRNGPGKVTTETQGSRWVPWLRKVDVLTVSPKPPSSGLTADASLPTLDFFLTQHFEGSGYREGRWVVLKCIVFDEEDYAFAQKVHEAFPELKFYLSTGTAMGGLSGRWVPPPIPDLRDYETDQFKVLRHGLDGKPMGDFPADGANFSSPTYTDTTHNLLRRYRWLAEKAMNDPAMADAAVGVQQHCLLWGIETRGV